MSCSLYFRIAGYSRPEGTYVVLVSSLCSVDTTAIHVGMLEGPEVTLSIEESIICDGWSLPWLLTSNMDGVTATIIVTEEGISTEYSFLLNEGVKSWEDYESIVVHGNGYVTLVSVVSSVTGCSNTLYQSVLYSLADNDDMAYAGPDRTYCSLSFNLEAIRPNTGSSGQWHVVYTNPVSANGDPDNPNSYVYLRFPC